jgi:hypothetical protein
MNDPMWPLPGLSPVSGRRVEVNFDGGLLSSDGGVLALRGLDEDQIRVQASVCRRRPGLCWVNANSATSN